MNRDFALRSNEKYHNPAFVNIWDGVYNNQNYKSKHVFLPQQSKSIYLSGSPILKNNPRKQIEHPLFKNEPTKNPAFRQKWNLPPQKPSLYFDQSAYHSYNIN